jgi:maleate cis-trans isomerase
MAETKLNTIFEQDGKVYAVCANHVSPKELAKFIRQELIYGTKHIPRFQMRVVTTEEFRKMPFGTPSKT